jgi:hypothetical protein
MTPERMGVTALIGVGALILIYIASQSTPDKVIVPDVQTELQFMGMNINGALSYNPGTVLDTTFETHFWAPKTNPRDYTNAPTVKSRCRYPVVPGGNASSVMHKGWGKFLEGAPDNDWFFNPPEAAVLLCHGGRLILSCSTV